MNETTISSKTFMLMGKLWLLLGICAAALVALTLLIQNGIISSQEKVTGDDMLLVYLFVAMAPAGIVLWYLSMQMKEKATKMAALVSSILFAFIGGAVLAQVSSLLRTDEMILFVVDAMAIVILCVLPTILVLITLIASRKLSSALMYMVAMVSMFIFVTVAMEGAEEQADALGFSIIVWLMASIYIVASWSGEIGMKSIFVDNVIYKILSAVAAIGIIANAALALNILLSDDGVLIYGASFLFATVAVAVMFLRPNILPQWC